MKTLFYVSLSVSWFDTPCDGIDYECSVRLDDEGKVVYIESCPENCVDVNKTWELNAEELHKIQKLIYRLFHCKDFMNQEVNDEYHGEKILSDSVIEKYSIFDGEENVEVSFNYKINYISSEFFCKKAPFTLTAKEVFNVIQMNYPDFHPLL